MRQASAFLILPVLLLVNAHYSTVCPYNEWETVKNYISYSKLS